MFIDHHLIFTDLYSTLTLIIQTIVISCLDQEILPRSIILDQLKKEKERKNHFKDILLISGLWCFI